MDVDRAAGKMTTLARMGATDVVPFIPLDGATMDDYADDVLSLLDHLDIQTAAVAGLFGRDIFTDPATAAAAPIIHTHAKTPANVRFMALPPQKLCAGFTSSSAPGPRRSC